MKKQLLITPKDGLVSVLIVGMFLTYFGNDTVGEYGAFVLRETKEDAEAGFRSRVSSF